MKRIYSLMFALALCTVALNAQYFTEDFEAGLPAGWEVTGNMALHADAASFSSQYFNVPDHTQFVGSNDDALGAGNDGGGTMTTGVIDLTAVPNGTVIVLSMESFFINGD